MSSSRLCVKNLPNFIDEKGLKKHFVSNGFTVTDVKVLRTKDGRSRCFGFVGLPSETVASKAKNYFDKTFINTAKLQVFFALPVGDIRLSKKKNPTNITKKEIPSKEKLSKKKKEFLELFESKKDAKANFWNEEEEVNAVTKINFVEKLSEPVRNNSFSTNRLFVRNLNYNTTEEELKTFFSHYGPVSSVKLIFDGLNKSKGFGFIEFEVQQHAIRAQSKADGHSFQGRILHVMPANAEKLRFQENSGEGSSAFQKEKDLERKKNAGNVANWNSLFLRTDAVLNSFKEIDRENLIFNPQESMKLLEKQRPDLTSTDSAAVNLALLEAKLIQETKDFLQDHGVNLKALEEGMRNPQLVKRSENTLLIKNLPNDADISELKQMFSKAGEIMKFVSPKTKTMALISFASSAGARSAFSNLAYKKYHRLPLYLEYAPEGTFNFSSSPVDEEQQGTLQNEPDNEDMEVSSLTLFVKNLNFETDDDELKEHVFKVAGKINGEEEYVRSCVVKKHANGLSRGYGFIEVNTKQSLKIVLRKLNGSTLAGHELQVSKSVSSSLKSESKKIEEQSLLKRNIKNNLNNDEGVSQRKLMVRNVDFAASKKEIRNLFAAFGELQSVRMPKKIGNGTRGFAFVTFMLPDDAKKAKGSLENAHLYGRKLVIEWAKDTSLESQTLVDLKRKSSTKANLLIKKQRI
eukprot:augustus_masked-scaffold_5-processed-gene-1.5-mRNA-1 protein AED:0.03 eAED:0.03 QI:0/-1/0/1/-1/1/1/0/688